MIDLRRRGRSSARWAASAAIVLVLAGCSSTNDVPPTVSTAAKPPSTSPSPTTGPRSTPPSASSPPTITSVPPPTRATRTQPPTRSARSAPETRPTLVATPERLAGRPFNDALAALAEEADQAGESLTLPAGSYVSPGTVALPVGTRLVMSTGAEITGDLPGQALVRVGARTEMSGGTIRNTATSPGFDLDFAEQAQSVRISGVRFSGAATNAVYLAAPGLRDVVIEKSRFQGVGYAILLNPGALDLQGLTIRGNTFRDVCSDSIEINAATGGTPRRVTGVRVLGNDIGPSCGAGDTAGFGIGLAGVRDFLVSGNTVRGARNEGIHLEDGTSDGRVHANRILSGGIGTRPAIAIYRTTSDLDIDRNRIDGFRGPGIAVLWDSLGSAAHVTLRSNTVSHVSGTGIMVAGDVGSGPFEVLDNHLDDVGGVGVGVAGSHALTVIRGNVLRKIRGPAIDQSLRGAGRTVIDHNDIR